MKVKFIFLILFLQYCISYESRPWSSYSLFTSEKNIVKQNVSFYMELDQRGETPKHWERIKSFDDWKTHYCFRSTVNPKPICLIARNDEIDYFDLYFNYSEKNSNSLHIKLKISYTQDSLFSETISLFSLFLIPNIYFGKIKFHFELFRGNEFLKQWEEEVTRYEFLHAFFIPLYPINEVLDKYFRMIQYKLILIGDIGYYLRSAKPLATMVYNKLLEIESENAQNNSLLKNENTNVEIKKENIDWEIKSSKLKESNGIYHIYYLNRLNFIQNGNIVWSKDVPDWLKTRELERSFKTLVNIKEYNEFPFIMGVFIEEKFIYIADIEGIALYKKETGKIFLNQKIKSENDFFFVDQGNAIIKNSSVTCEMNTKRGTLFSKCGDKIYYFNGSKVIVLDLEGKIIEEVKYNFKIHEIPTNKISQRKIKIQMTNSYLEISGIVFLR